MAPSTARGAPANQDAATTFDNTPSWDTSPNTFPQYYQELLAWLPKQESRFTLLAQQYVALDRGLKCCVSENHARRVDTGLLVKGSFKNPVLVKPNDVVMVPPLVAPTAMPPSPSVAGAPAPAAAPTPTTPSTANVMAANQIVRPMVIERVDSDLWLLITSTIPDDDTVDDLLARADIGQESGIRLLIHFKAKATSIATELSTSYADTITQQMAELEAIGLSSCKVSEFNIYKTKLNNLRKLLPNDVPCSDVAFAHKLVVAVRNLGPLVASELNNAMRIDQSKGDLAKTRDTIVAVLSELEPSSNDNSRALLGRAGGDPLTGRQGQEGGGRARGGASDATAAWANAFLRYVLGGQPWWWPRAQQCWDPCCWVLQLWHAGCPCGRQ